MRPSIVGGLVAAGLAAASLLGVAAAGADGSGDVRGGTPAVVVRDGDGEPLARVPLSRTAFAVAYRNSIYESRAEERYTVLADGRFRLERVAADERAVIEEYYAIPGPHRTRPGDRRTWVVASAPGRRPVFDDLAIAATDLGRRTLLVPGHAPVDLWRLVDDEHPTVVLDIERKP